MIILYSTNIFVFMLLRCSCFSQLLLFFLVLNYESGSGLCITGGDFGHLDPDTDGDFINIRSVYFL